MNCRNQLVVDSDLRRGGLGGRRRGGLLDGWRLGRPFWCSGTADRRSLSEAGLTRFDSLNKVHSARVGRGDRWQAFDWSASGTGADGLYIKADAHRGGDRLAIPW